MKYVIATEDEIKLLPGTPLKDIIITGVGFGNVYRALKDVDRNEPLVNIGYAGSNKIPVGSWCSIKYCSSYHTHADFEEQEYELKVGPLPKKKYKCFTSSDFVTETPMKSPAVFDMELYAIMSMGFTNVESWKYISDNLSYKEYEKNIK